MSQAARQGKFAVREEGTELEDLNSSLVIESLSTGLVTWSTTNDSENPKNWTKKKKLCVVLVLVQNAWCCGMSSTVVAPAFAGIQTAFGISTEASILGVSLTVLGWAMGPLILSPASEIWGRNAVYIPTWSAFVAFNLGSALSKNAPAFLICRFFAGIFGGPIIAIAPASAYDMFEAKDVGPSVLLLSVAAMLGSTLGEVFGGLLAQHAGWRWTLWFLLIVSGVSLVSQVLVPETHGPTVLAHKARRLQKKTGKSFHTEVDLHGLHKATIFKTAVWRPLQLLALEPIVFFCSLSLAFVWGVLYLYLGAYLFVFAKVYGFKEGSAGAAFTGISVGVLFGLFTAPITKKIYINLTAKHGKGEIYPEARLPVAMACVFFFPLSIFWFSWTAKKNIHWIVPVLSGIPFGLGQCLLFLTFVLYTVDSFPHLSASVGAANALLRLLFAMAFPLITPKLYNNLSTEWAGSVLGFISLAFVPVPFLFYKYGPWLRSKSRFNPRFV